MITVLEVYNSISKSLRDKFGLKVYSVNTEEGFTPECFYIEIPQLDTTRSAAGLVRDEFTIRITFIPKTEKEIKRVLQIKNDLQALFESQIKINDAFHIDTVDKTFTITTNNTVELLMQFELVQKIAEEDKPLMGEITIN